MAEKGRCSTASSHYSNSVVHRGFKTAGHYTTRMSVRELIHKVSFSFDGFSFFFLLNIFLNGQSESFFKGEISFFFIPNQQWPVFNFRPQITLPAVFETVNKLVKKNMCFVLNSWQQKNVEMLTIGQLWETLAIKTLCQSYRLIESAAFLHHCVS